MAIPAYGLWAKTKPLIPLYCHLIDTGETARALLSTDGFSHVVTLFTRSTDCPSEQARGWLAYITALHDIGKCHGAFQALGPPEVVSAIETKGLRCIHEPNFRHEAAGASWLVDHLNLDLGWDLRSSRTASEACRGHHGSFRIDDPLPERDGIHPAWERARLDLEHLVRTVFAPWEWRARFIDHSAAGIILSGLIVLSDWIASNIELFPVTTSPAPDLAAYIGTSHERAERAVHRLGLDARVVWGQGQRFQDVWPAMIPRPVQEACEELCRADPEPGLTIIEAPMGEGKTEAALYLAAQWFARTGRTGMYVALPTAATSNQMYARVREFLSARDPSVGQGVRLVHGMAWLVDASTPTSSPALADSSDLERAKALDWFRPRKRSLIAPYGVGTIDQALLSVLHVRHGFLRLFGLSGKVLIIDEVHAYDAYMTEILTLLLHWCYALDIPVILLSATLPGERREALARAYGGQARDVGPLVGRIPYPIITVVPRVGSTRFLAVTGSAQKMRLHILLHQGSLGNAAAVAAIVHDAALRGGCHCVIANTVDSAQAIYRSLKELCGRGSIQVILFHARFVASRRREIESQVLAWFDKRSLKTSSDPERTTRPPAAVLVATQVVEQSLDLDFDEMFTEIAPIDLLLQRAGRLHRHDRPNRPTGPDPRLHVFTPSQSDGPDFAGSEHVYERYILLRSLSAIGAVDDLLLPEDIRPLVEQVYRGPDAEGRCSSETADLESAWQLLQGRRDKERRSAEKYLVPWPDPARFCLAAKPSVVFDEDESDAASYFAAKTRYGDDSESILALEGAEFDDDLGRSTGPTRAVLGSLLLRGVSIPRYWLRGIDPAPGYREVIQAPDWLIGMKVVRFSNGIWEGVRSRTGRRVVMTNDPELGLKFEEVK